MKYSKRQLKGLLDSADIWVEKYEGRCNTYGRPGCPLCKLYYKNDCWACPIKLSTGLRFCRGTPYANIPNIYIPRGRKTWSSDREIIRDREIQVSKMYDAIWWRYYATKKDKLKELQFIISLLPKSYQKRYKKYEVK